MAEVKNRTTLIKLHEEKWKTLGEQWSAIGAMAKIVARLQEVLDEVWSDGIPDEVLVIFSAWTKPTIRFTTPPSSYGEDKIKAAASALFDLHKAFVKKFGKSKRYKDEDGFAYVWGIDGIYVEIDGVLPPTCRLVVERIELGDLTDGERQELEEMLKTGKRVVTTYKMQCD